MQSRKLLPKFWRHHGNGTDMREKAVEPEVPESKSQAAERLAEPRSELLSCDDIYRSCGILSPPSGYGIHKVVEMLNSDHIREMSKDVKRASVLMALDAAGTPVKDLLEDATVRQQALNSYEVVQHKHLEEFESRKGREVAQLQAEMERVTAHYADRIKRSLDEVSREKEGFHKWQTLKEQESVRISEVIGLCAKPEPAAVAMVQAPETGPRVLARPAQSAVRP